MDKETSGVDLFYIGSKPNGRPVPCQLWMALDGIHAAFAGRWRGNGKIPMDSNMMDVDVQR